MNSRTLALSSAVALFLISGSAQTLPSAARPRILGVAHIGLRTDNLDAARQFYKQQLGYDEAFSLNKPDGSLMLVYFKVNDHQYIEVFPGKTPEQLALSHIAFETDNAPLLRDYLAGKGVKVPATLRPGLDGNISFMIKDPDGHDVEFVQYMTGSLHSRNFGKFLPATRVSERIIHVGTTVSDRAAYDALYRDILGFREFWHGGMTDAVTSWVDMRVPDGTDWFEYMLDVREPTPKNLGVMNHMALGVPAIQKGYQTVMGRGLNPPQPPKIGRDGKWQLNLYDPSLTRAELMEPKPVEKPCCSPMLN
jgi:catechol 2,3-dioxygenase-like lactoylglutathione lyase family enzyme